METPLISRKLYNRIRRHLPPQKSRRSVNDRRVISGIIRIILTGSTWRQPPKIYGKWKTVYSRFRRSSKFGLWKDIFNIFAKGVKRGKTTKLPLLRNEEGTPFNCLITGGEVSDIKEALNLIYSFPISGLIADKAYGSKAHRRELRREV